MFISATIAALLFVIGLSAMFSTRVQAFLGAVPVANKLFMPKTWAVLFIVVGLAFGGASLAWDKAKSASFGSSASQQEPLAGISATTLEYCTYSAGDTNTTAVGTLRADTGSQNKVFLDIDESLWNATNANNNEANTTFSCTRAGGVSEAGSVRIVVNSDKYYSENTVSDSTQYALAARTASPSLVWSGPVQSIYVANGAYATSASKKEYTDLTFAEGVKSATLGVMLEVDRTGFLQLNNYTSKTVTVSERAGSSDKPVAFIVVNKVP